METALRVFGSNMLELTAAQIAILERFRTGGFEIVAFPMYATCVGVRKGNCAALLAPVSATSLRIFGDPSYLIEGNLSVRVRRRHREIFVWKNHSLEATPARLAELRSFTDELHLLLRA